MKKTMMIMVLILMIICSSGLSFAQNKLSADDLLSKAQNFLASKFNMTFRYPIRVSFVAGVELDKILGDSPYKGGEVGLYKFTGGVNQVYLLKDYNYDLTYGCLCHELTHAWQKENCPNQSLTLKEGLAKWIEYKALYYDRAYTYANQINQYLADPVYGVGYRFIQKLEDKYGEAKVLSVVKGLKDIQ